MQSPEVHLPQHQFPHSKVYLLLDEAKPSNIIGIVSCKKSRQHPYLTNFKVLYRNQIKFVFDVPFLFDQHGFPF